MGKLGRGVEDAVKTPSEGCGSAWFFNSSPMLSSKQMRINSDLIRAIKLWFEAGEGKDDCSQDTSLVALHFIKCVYRF